jgi:hypothetical protein
MLHCNVQEHVPSSTVTPNMPLQDMSTNANVLSYSSIGDIFSRDVTNQSQSSVFFKPSSSDVKNDDVNQAGLKTSFSQSTLCTDFLPRSVPQSSPVFQVKASTIPSSSTLTSSNTSKVGEPYWPSQCFPHFQGPSESFSSHELSITRSKSNAKVQIMSSSGEGGSSENVSKFHCFVCSYVTGRWSSMALHLKCHSNAAAVACQSCGNPYRSLSSYQSHLPNCHKSSRTDTVQTLDRWEEVNTNESSCLLEGFVPALALQLSGQHRLTKSAQNSVFSSIAFTTATLLDTTTPELLFRRLQLFSDECCRYVNSRYRDKAIQNFFNIPQPKGIKIGDRMAFFYPFVNLLEWLLRLPEMEDFLLQPISESSVMYDIMDGSWVSHIRRENFLYLALYADDLGICNPLGQARSKHKLMVVYIQILNIPPKYRSKIVSVFPLAVCYTNSLRPNFKDSLNLLLKDFLDFMQILHHVGHSFQLRERRLHLYGRVVAFVGDSLAANAFGGFKEAFSNGVRRFCRACNCTRQEMIASSSNGNLRTKSEHELRVRELSDKHLTGATRKYWSKEYGINSDSVLRPLPEFSVTDCLLFDPMHDILEGLFPAHLELLLKVHTVEMQLFSLREFNDFMDEKALLPCRDKPNKIYENISIIGKQTSSQMMSLMRAMSFFYAEEPNRHDDHWKCMLSLIHIMQLVLSPVVTEKFLADLEAEIDLYHSAFLRLYPDKFRPKLHFLSHYPLQAKKFGPLRNHMCFTFEARHQIIKNVRWFNFRNLCLSIMNHLSHDLASRITLPSGDFNDMIFVQPPTEIQSNKTTFNGISYNIHDILMLNESPMKLIRINGLAKVHNRLQLQCTKLRSSTVICDLLRIDGDEADLVFYVDALVFPWPVLQKRVGDVLLIQPIALPDLSHVQM